MTRFAEAALRAARTACGPMGWRAADFWAATPAELVTALEGFRPEGVGAALGRADLETMMEALDGRGA